MYRADMVMGIDTLLCPVTDMDRSVAFYREVLQIAPGYVSPHWSSFDLGGVRLGLHPAWRAGAPGQSWVIAFRVQDVQIFRRRLAEIGYPTDAEYHDVPSGVVLDFYDPDGNALQAMQHGVKVATLASE